MLPNIALYGHSGSGKTIVAEYLVSTYAYYRCSTGLTCREICRLLFQTESKDYLNRVTDAMRAIDRNVWLRLALRDAPRNRPIVFDSVRFQNDYAYLRSLGFCFWRIDASLEVRTERLRRRGQEFNPSRDDIHRAEVELEDCEFDYRIRNEDCGLLDLYEEVDKALSAMPGTSGLAREVSDAP